MICFQLYDSIKLNVDFLEYNGDREFKLYLDGFYWYFLEYLYVEYFWFN